MVPLFRHKDKDCIVYSEILLSFVVKMPHAPDSSESGRYAGSLNFKSENYDVVIHQARRF